MPRALRFTTHAAYGRTGGGGSRHAERERSPEGSGLLCERERASRRALTSLSTSVRRVSIYSPSSLSRRESVTVKGRSSLADFV